MVMETKSCSLVRVRRPKAKKSYQCSLCGGMIKLGEVYARIVAFKHECYPGGVDWKLCPQCFSNWKAGV